MGRKMGFIKKGYSLLELMIVMGVFIILAALSLNALRSFREGAQYRSATLEFESTIEEVRNLARNNVVSRQNSVNPSDATTNSFEIQIAGYFIELDPSFLGTPTSEGVPMKVYSCTDGNFNNTISPNEIICNQQEQWVLFNSDNFANIDMEFVGDSCEGVFFRNASSDLFITDVDMTQDVVLKDNFRPCFGSSCSETTCSVQLSLGDSVNRRATYTFTQEGNRFIREQ